MATKDELKIEIEWLTEANAELKQEIELLTASNDERKARIQKEEGPDQKLVKLLWAHPVEKTNRNAYGHQLFPEKDHHYAMVPEGRVNMELAREGKAFVKTLKAVKEVTEVDNDIEDKE